MKKGVFIGSVFLMIISCQGDAGLLITTGKETEVLENYITKKSIETGKTIDLIAGKDLAKFVLRYAPELLVGEE